MSDAARCPICGSPGGRAVWQGRGRGGVRRILRCRSCGAGYVDPMPSPAELARWYGESYFASCYGGDRSRAEARQGAVLDEAARRLGRPHGSLLDVGCGIGDLAASARSRGWQVTAIEPAPAAVRRARERGIEVVVGEAAEALAGPAAPGPFDLVVFRDSLSHMPAAGSALAGAVRRLSPGCWLAVRVPNRHPGVLRAARWAARVGDASGVLHLPAQVLHLDAGSLTAALGRQGLEQVTVAGESEGVAESGGRYSRRALPDLAMRLLVRRWRRRGQAEALWAWGRRP